MNPILSLNTCIYDKYITQQMVITSMFYMDRENFKQNDAFNIQKQIQIDGCLSFCQGVNNRIKNFVIFVTYVVHNKKFLERRNFFKTPMVTLFSVELSSIDIKNYKKGHFGPMPFYYYYQLYTSHTQNYFSFLLKAQ